MLDQLDGFEAESAEAGCAAGPRWPRPRWSPSCAQRSRSHLDEYLRALDVELDEQHWTRSALPKSALHTKTSRPP
jgi:hypothetical protein